MASVSGARRSTSLSKRHDTLSSSSDKVTVGKKRQPLTNITNHKHASGPTKTLNSGRTKILPCTTKTTRSKRETLASGKPSFSNAALPLNSSVKRSTVAPNKVTSVASSKAIVPGFRAVKESLDHSDSFSVSMDESMSTCDSLKSPDVEYMDCSETAAVYSVEHKASNMPCISDHKEFAGGLCKRDIISTLDNNIVDIDANLDDPQLCATLACDIYKHLRESEAKKRPATNYMEKVQKDVNASMRAILVDWLVEVSEEYRLVPDTLYLTVNYIDRYLSGNVMDRQKLQLLGVACMMIASKYEEICAPRADEFCYITDSTYLKDEVLQMESDVLNCLKFEMTAPTAKCFLRRFILAAQGVNETPLLQLECLSNYISELSLLEYNMLCFAPSLLAASSVFLAKFILLPSKRPWNSTLNHYTNYNSSDLRECVMALHSLCCNSQSSTLPAIREKYSQHKYKFVAKKYCPPSIPQDFFHNSSA